MKKVFTLFLLFTFLNNKYGFAQHQVITNHSFEDWYTTTYGNEMPEGSWYNIDSFMSINGIVEKTTDAYSGAYAMKLNAFDDNSRNQRILGDCYTGKCCDIYSSPYGTEPISSSYKFLVFYYKYKITTTDTAVVNVKFTDGISGTYVGGRTDFLYASDDWVKKVIRVNPTGTATHLLLRFSASNNSAYPSGRGNSSLYIDSVYLTDDTTTLSMPQFTDANHKIEIYPNPMKDELTLKSTQSGLVSVYDFTGKLIYTNKIVAKQPQTINVNSWSRGVYFYKIESSEQNTYTGKLIKH